MNLFPIITRPNSWEKINSGGRHFEERLRGGNLKMFDSVMEGLLRFARNDT